ncbi:hypothetical protein KQI61_05725 [Anaerocolumna aminovalerica]|uniref:hypothetical protein n=1 Tax=Anaerocolumna aminovalerica TaxID=1527 RepID=UPI001C0ECC6B|nr:hypothetical protein [Anaerocolumna aminovalerica]MBU5331689.1 hypothetical protein [Anaerocolumna aminovalerica]
MREIINQHTQDGSRKTFEIKNGWIYFKHAKKPMKFIFKTKKGFKLANWKFIIQIQPNAQRGMRLRILIRNPLFQLDKHNWGFNLCIGKHEIMHVGGIQ